MLLQFCQDCRAVRLSEDHTCLPWCAEMLLVAHILNFQCQDFTTKDHNEHMFTYCSLRSQVPPFDNPNLNCVVFWRCSLRTTHQIRQFWIFAQQSSILCIVPPQGQTFQESGNELKLRAPPGTSNMKSVQTALIADIEGTGKDKL